jgi:hypothetical protein
MNTMPPAGQVPPRPGPMLSVDQQRAILWRRIARSANWWYWIAGVSLVNTGAFFMHSSWGFALGTGVVDAANAIFESQPAIALVIDAVIIGLIALWGVLCTKGLRWAFWVGMILYALDTILVLVFKQWISAAFHAYAIFQIYQGVASANLLRKLDAAVAAQGPYNAQPAPAAGWSAQPPANTPQAQQPGTPWHPGMTVPGQLEAAQTPTPETEPGEGAE